jgi:hypothetical protein
MLDGSWDHEQRHKRDDRCDSDGEVFTCPLEHSNRYDKERKRGPERYEREREEVERAVRDHPLSLKMSGIP